MDKIILIKKLALYAAYALFAGFSAYFTATSFSLNLLHTDGIVSFIVVYLLVFIVAVMAGWCLTNVIEEFNKTRGASKAKFSFSIIGFLLFWAVSFTTNVHYFFIEKHGFVILGQELSSAKSFINENTDKTNKEVKEKMESAVTLVTNHINANMIAFNAEIQNTINGRYGFGQACVSILKSTEDILNGTNGLYGERNITYQIFNDNLDAGDIGMTTRTSVLALYSKYAGRMEQQKNMKIAAIRRYFNGQLDQNVELRELLKPIEVIDKKHYPEVAKDGSANAYFKCQQYQQTNVIDKMPQEFAKSCVEYDSDKNVKSIKVYPSARMFETMTVWNDMFHHRLPDGMPMIQWIVISLIFDIIAFLLFALAKLIK